MSVAEAAAALSEHVQPRLGIVLGSGLGAVADAVQDAATISYEELPGFPRPGVAGHAGRAVLGRLGGVPVCVLMGRAHFYEGGDPAPRVTPVRALRASGAEIRAFRILGADAVGMSTVHETILARHAGMRVAAVSAISNLAEGMSDVPLSHEQTLADAQRAAGDLARLLEGFVGRLA